MRDLALPKTIIATKVCTSIMLCCYIAVHDKVVPDLEAMSAAMENTMMDSLPSPASIPPGQAIPEEDKADSVQAQEPKETL